MNKITESQRVVIFTKYYPPTDHQGARIKAFTFSNAKVWIGYPHEARDPHQAAALALCAKMEWPWNLIQGNTNDGCVFLFTPPTKKTRQLRLQRGTKTIA